MAPWIRPSHMNGTRMNQLVAPTSFMTWISRRRANVASRMVLTMRNSDDASRTPAMAKKRPRIQRIPARRRRTCSLAVRTVSIPSLNRLLKWAATFSVSSAFLGATRKETGRPSGSMFDSSSGSPAKIRLASLKASSLEKNRNRRTSGDCSSSVRTAAI